MVKIGREQCLFILLDPATSSGGCPGIDQAWLSTDVFSHRSHLILTFFRGDSAVTAENLEARTERRPIRFMLE